MSSRVLPRQKLIRGRTSALALEELLVRPVLRATTVPPTGGAKGSQTGCAVSGFLVLLETWRALVVEALVFVWPASLLPRSLLWEQESGGASGRSCPGGLQYTGVLVM